MCGGDTLGVAVVIVTLYLVLGWAKSLMLFANGRT